MQKTTLQQFLGITGFDLIIPKKCYIYINGSLMNFRNGNELYDINNIMQYLNYKIVGFKQKVSSGLITQQIIYLNK